jgi:hypothetical protein
MSHDMFAPLPFALHATAGCPPHAELALSLAWTFDEVDAAALDAELDAIATLLPAPATNHPLDELKTLAPLALRCVAPPSDVDTDGVLLHTALDAAAPHPLAIAIVGTELARRRGMSIGIVSNGEDHCLAHAELPAPLLLVVETGEIVDAHALPATLTWRCAHETAGLLLDELEPRWLAQGRLDRALQAAELRLCLPFDDNGKRIAQRKLHRVQARLN